MKTEYISINFLNLANYFIKHYLTVFKSFIHNRVNANDTTSATHF